MSDLEVKMSDLEVKMVKNSITLRNRSGEGCIKVQLNPPHSFGVIYPSRFLMFRCIDTAVQKMPYGASLFNRHSCPSFPSRKKLEPNTRRSFA
jgi:hypothetical protein